MNRKLTFTEPLLHARYESTFTNIISFLLFNNTRRDIFLLLSLQTRKLRLRKVIEGCQSHRPVRSEVKIHSSICAPRSYGLAVVTGNTLSNGLFCVTGETSRPLFSVFAWAIFCHSNRWGDKPDLIYLTHTHTSFLPIAHIIIWLGTLDPDSFD